MATTAGRLQQPGSCGQADQPWAAARQAAAILQHNVVVSHVLKHRTTVDRPLSQDAGRTRQLENLRHKYTVLVYRKRSYATPVESPQFPGHRQQPLQHLPWSAQLEAQLHAVIQELGFSKEAAGVLVRAAHAKRIPSNPGILLAQAVELLCLAGTIGSRADILTMIAVWPGLINCSPTSVSSTYHAMADLIPPPQLLQLLLRSPSILSCTPFALWSKYHALGTLLDMPAGRVGKILQKAPRLITTSPALLRQRFQSLQHYFDLSAEEVRSLIRKQPLLLASHSNTVAVNAELLLKHLKLPPTLVIRMILKQPALLLYSESALENKLSHYCSMLELDVPAFATMLIKQPSLLNFTPTSISSKLDHLQHLLPMQRQTVLQVVRTCPALLTLAPASITHKWGLLQQWAALCPAWEEQLAAATPGTLGLYLCFSAKRLARLRYVAQLGGGGGGWKLHRLLMMSQKEVVQVFPGLDGWLQGQEECREV